MHMQGSPAAVTASVAEAHAPLCEIVGTPLHLFTVAGTCAVALLFADMIHIVQAIVFSRLYQQQSEDLFTSHTSSLSPVMLPRGSTNSLRAPIDHASRSRPAWLFCSLIGQDWWDDLLLTKLVWLCTTRIWAELMGVTCA